MKPSKVKNRRAWNSTLPAPTKPLSRSSQKTKTRKPVKKKPRSTSEFNRIYGSRERVRFVKDLPCVACMSISPCFAAATARRCHNAHTENGGMGRKAGYRTIVPLCPSHHRRFDLHQVPFHNEVARDAIRACAPQVEALWLAERANWAQPGKRT